MFNLKEKLNQFLDDLEEEEPTKVAPKEPIEESVDDFKNKQEQLSSYLDSLKDEHIEIETAKFTISTSQPETIAPPKINLQQIEQPEVKPVSMMKEPTPISLAAHTSNEISILTDDLVVVGDIITSDPLQMNGEVKGNITCQSKLVLNGNVDGDIKAQSVSINSANINGSISADENVIVSGDSSVVGDIFNNSIAIDGTLNGSIYASGRVQILENAEIYGNVTAASISMEEGAIIQGNVSIKH